jgi:hypothetical protein
MAMDEDECLHRYGLHPVGAGLAEARGLLRVQIRLEQQAQGEVRLSCRWARTR